MAKEFNKKFMHPTRRKLVDMVLTGGEYEKNTQISFSGADKEKIKREVGEKWTDEKLISKTGYCITCLAQKESEIKLDGLWGYYETYKITSNMISHGKDVVAQFKQAYEDAKQEYEVVNEDGTLEKWSMERDVEELKAEIMVDIVNFEKEIEEATKLRNQAYEQLKHKNYDLVRPLKD
jgi:membrane-bound lytic murein transglycosylase B